MRAFVLMLTLLSALGCAVQRHAHRSDTTSATTGQGEVSASIASETEGDGAENAFVQRILLRCGNDAESIALASDTQSAVIYRDVKDCLAELQTFAILTESGPLTYERTTRLTEGLPVFDADTPDVRLKSRLVSEASQFTYDCMGPCTFGRLEADFTYSVLLAETIKVKNHPRFDEKVTCLIEAKFSCVKSRPDLSLKFSLCRYQSVSAPVGPVEFAVTTATILSEEQANHLVDHADLSFDGKSTFHYSLPARLLEEVLSDNLTKVSVVLRHQGSRTALAHTVSIRSFMQVSQSPSQSHRCD